MCRVFKDPQWHPADSLEKILLHQNGTSQLDGTYLPVLNRLLLNQSDARRQQLIEEYQKVIGAIIMLENPLSVYSLSRLIDLPEKSITLRLNSLHSVFHVPSHDTSQPVRPFHLSFRDYLLDPATRRKTAIWIDGKEMHQRLAMHCLNLMSHNLRKNICDLPGYGTELKEIDSQCISQHLPSELQYSCQYWVQHLANSSYPSTLIASVFSFLKEHFLHWMEAMNVLGLGSEIVGIISTLQQVMQVKSPRA